MDHLSLVQLTSQTEGNMAVAGSALNTGDLRRQYAFGPRVSELSPRRDPFFRLLSKFRRFPTDDPNFKFTEERKSWHKRYAYVIGHGLTSIATNDATIDGSTGPNTDVAVGSSYKFRLATDYKGKAGNLTNVYGQTGSNSFQVGASGTAPQFLIPGQIIKTNLCTTTAAITANPTVGDYMLWKIVNVNLTDTHADVDVVCVRTAQSDTYREFTSFVSATAPLTTVATARIHDNLERRRTYVVGTAFAPGSGLPETWSDQPYSTGYGQTEIFKTALGMDGETEATVLKYAPSEWARLWGNKMIEHNWDIETACHFSFQYTDDDNASHTQGGIDYVLQYGNIFDYSTDDTQDDFLDELSQFFDPRIGNADFTVFQCRTDVYNWLNKLSGYFANNVNVSPNYKADFTPLGLTNVAGVNINRIWTIYGTMNLVQNVHLDSSPVAIAAYNLNNVKYRPLIGNGKNRDTSVYVGVQTLQNTGVDKRVDLIMTQAGLEWTLPESHAIWTDR